MLEILRQPIVNIFTGQKVMEELLSRPGYSIKEYFTTNDRNTLIRRELHAILQGVEESTTEIPCNINVTPYTLHFISWFPFINWRGGIEIVEWDKSISPNMKQIRNAIRDMQAKGLMVWVDDVIAADLSKWLRTGVDGYKVELPEIKNNPDFLRALKETKKPIIVERVETDEDHFWVKDTGITLAQGYYYGRPAKVENLNSLRTAYDFKTERG